MPRIFENIKKQLLPALQETLLVAERADFSLGYFNLRGWRHLASHVDGWAGGDGQCCRLLIGMHINPTDELLRALRTQEGEDELDNQSASLEKRRIAEDFRSQLTVGVPTHQDESALRHPASQIRAKKLVVKVYQRHPLHAKLYLRHRQDVNNPSANPGRCGTTYVALRLHLQEHHPAEPLRRGHDGPGGRDL